MFSLGSNVVKNSGLLTNSCSQECKQTLKFLMVCWVLDSKNFINNFHFNIWFFISLIGIIMMYLNLYDSGLANGIGISFSLSTS